MPCKARGWAGGAMSLVHNSAPILWLRQAGLDHIVFDDLLVFGEAVEG